MGRVCALLLLACSLLAGTGPAFAADVPVVPGPGTPAVGDTDFLGAPGEPLSCVQRVAIPAIEQVTVARWSPDGRRLAFSKVVKSASRKTITGYEEDLHLGVLDIERGTVRDFGLGAQPEWSTTGTYLSYWRAGVVVIQRGTERVGRVEPTALDVHWVGDQLLYWSDEKIRVWDEVQDVVLSRVDREYMPIYPADDVYFSSTGALFAMTRYHMDGAAYRYVGDTRTGQVAPLDVPGTTYLEWSPSGETLLVRSNDRVELLGTAGEAHAAPLSQFQGAVHGWTPDGKALLLGSIAPTLSAATAFDRFAVWDGKSAGGFATLPNLIGSRTFSPDGRYFAGTARSGLDGMDLEVYRCGTSLSAGMRAAPVARGLARTEEGQRRFVLPVAGWISQFVQGRHSGIDIAAPVGSVITAADGGTVTFVGWVPVGGRAVCVDHGGELESCYYHTSLTYVSVGQRVERGQPVAAIGMSGATTGAHVHWEVKLNGMIVDPLSR